MNLSQSLLRSNCIVVNKTIADAISINSALMLAELIKQYEHYNKSNLLSEDGFYCVSVNSIENATTLTKYQQAQCISKMIDLNLIQIDRQGLPCKRYFKLNIKNIEEFILGLEHSSTRTKIG